VLAISGHFAKFSNTHQIFLLYGTSNSVRAGSVRIVCHKVLIDLVMLML